MVVRCSRANGKANGSYYITIGYIGDYILYYNRVYGSHYIIIGYISPSIVTLMAKHKWKEGLTEWVIWSRRSRWVALQKASLASLVARKGYVRLIWGKVAT